MGLACVAGPTPMLCNRIFHTPVNSCPFTRSQRTPRAPCTPCSPHICPRSTPPQVFSLTGRTGSLVYLAPEAYKNEPYNDKVGVGPWALAAEAAAAAAGLIAELNGWLGCPVMIMITHRRRPTPHMVPLEMFLLNPVPRLRVRAFLIDHGCKPTHPGPSAPSAPCFPTPVRWTCTAWPSSCTSCSAAPASPTHTSPPSCPPSVACCATPTSSQSVWRPATGRRGPRPWTNCRPSCGS